MFVGIFGAVTLYSLSWFCDCSHCYGSLLFSSAFSWPVVGIWLGFLTINPNNDQHTSILSNICWPWSRIGIWEGSDDMAATSRIWCFFSKLVHSMSDGVEKAKILSTVVMFCFEGPQEMRAGGNQGHSWRLFGVAVKHWYLCLQFLKVFSCVVICGGTWLRNINTGIW